MDEFLTTWKPQDHVPVREFASRYFAWCDSHIRPRTKVNTETLEPYGFQVVDGKVVGIPKKSIE
jgi:hypothetical protein